MEQARTGVTVQGVFAYRDQPDVYYVVVYDSRERQTAIFVGSLEAFAISAALQFDPPERPLTHDTMLNLVTLTGGVVEEAYVNDLRDETFYAIIRVRVGAEVKELDVRPSDALALALRAKCPHLRGRPRDRGSGADVAPRTQ